VGNATQGFKRLLHAVDEAAASGIFGGDAVFIQSGNNPDFSSRHCEHQPFINMQKFESLVRDSNLVVSHAGAGTLLHVFQAGKIPVVMPRRKQHDELVDDHQLELVEVLAKEGRVVPALEPEDLANAVDEARRRNLQPSQKSLPRIIGLLQQTIEELTQ